MGVLSVYVLIQVPLGEAVIGSVSSGSRRRLLVLLLLLLAVLAVALGLGIRLGTKGPAGDTTTSQIRCSFNYACSFLRLWYV
jgi:hypothetical protein